MHQILFTVREVLPADLPAVRDTDATERPATDAELLNLGLQRLAGDLFSCAEQYRSDDDDIVELADGRRERAWWHERDDGPWASEDEKLRYPRSPELCARKFGPGQLLTHGQIRARFNQLDHERRRLALRARVIRSESVNVRETVEASLKEQRQAFLAHVGEVRADLASERALRAEARRLAALPSNDLQPVMVPEADVLDGDDVIEEAGIIPHSWAGEPVAR